MGGTEPTDGPDLIVSFDGRTDIRLAANGAFTIGRDGPPSDMSISHPAVSRLHGRLIPGKQWHLVDYESMNGIYLDGARIEHTAPITDGMTVHLANPKGPTITFRYVNPEDTTAPSPTTLAAGAGIGSVDSYTRTTDLLRAVIDDVLRMPPIEDPEFARATLSLLQRLVQLQTEFETFTDTAKYPETAGYLACVRAMYNGLVIRMSAFG